MKTDLNKLIASVLSALLTVSGATMFIIGLFFGYLVAKSPFLLFGLIVIVGIVLFYFRKKIDFSQIRANMRKTSVSQEAPSPPPQKSDAPSSEEKKTEEKEKKKRIIIELE